MLSFEKDLLVAMKETDDLLRGVVKPYRIDKITPNGRKYFFKKYGQAFIVSLVPTDTQLLLEFKNDLQEAKVTFDLKKYVESTNQKTYKNRYFKRIADALKKFDKSINI